MDIRSFFGRPKVSNKDSKTNSKKRLSLSKNVSAKKLNAVSKEAVLTNNNNKKKTNEDNPLEEIVLRLNDDDGGSKQKGDSGKKSKVLKMKAEKKEILEIIDSDGSETSDEFEIHDATPKANKGKLDGSKVSVNNKTSQQSCTKPGKKKVLEIIDSDGSETADELELHDSQNTKKNRSDDDESIKNNSRSDFTTRKLSKVKNSTRTAIPKKHKKEVKEISPAVFFSKAMAPSPGQKDSTAILSTKGHTSNALDSDDDSASNEIIIDVKRKQTKKLARKATVDSDYDDDFTSVEMIDTPKKGMKKRARKLALVGFDDDDSTTDEIVDMKPTKKLKKLLKEDTNKFSSNEKLHRQHNKRSPADNKKHKKNDQMMLDEESDSNDNDGDYINSLSAESDNVDDDDYIEKYSSPVLSTPKHKKVNDKSRPKSTRKTTSKSIPPKRAPYGLPNPAMSATPLLTEPIEVLNDVLILTNYTFVITGMLTKMSRESCEDYIKILGGRVTTAVSGRTDYLICGTELEDGRKVEEGSKHRRASELNNDSKNNIVILQNGDCDLYTIVNQLHLAYKKQNPEDLKMKSEVKTPTPNKNGTATRNPYATKPTNPYAKNKATTTPTRNINPYAQKKRTSIGLSSPDLSVSTSSMNEKRAKSNNDKRNNTNALWADKYAPQTTREILGNGDSVKKLSEWLRKWEQVFNQGNKSGSFGGPQGPKKAALLSGPPGIGKTTTALLVAEESGRDIVELNASDVRSKKSMEQKLGDVTGSQVLNFSKSKMKRKSANRRVIIMDEVDGMGAGDRSGMAELIKMIKLSKVPIICICNDRQSQKIRSLAAYCLDLRYRRPVKTVIARRAVEIGSMQNMRVELNAAEAISESCGNDIRQVLNCLQMWSSKKQHSSNGATTGKSADMTYKALKERENVINKDSLLRVSMFDATKMIVEGCRGGASLNPIAKRDSFFKRNDAYFTDYSLMGLNVHQNYLKVIISQFQESKRSGDMDAESNILHRMHEATQSMSDYALVEHSLRGEQNWQLLPLCAMLTIKAGHHVAGDNGGFLPGYPEFAGWLGKNSSRGRKMRIQQELRHHINYRSSADSLELRLRYFPALRQKFLSLMMDEAGPRTSDTISLMDEYGLDRDDLFENMDEFLLDPKAIKFTNLDSKRKASFTREYNKGIHKSQALVIEQGGGKSAPNKKNKSVSTEELDVVNDDIEEDNDEDDDDDDKVNEKMVKAMFKKKSKRVVKPKGKKEKRSNGKKK